MNLLQKVVYPFIWVLSKSSQLLLNILHIKTGNDSQVTEEEIKAILQQGAETGIVDEIEQDIVRRAFFLGDVKISSLMTYRSDIIWVDITRNFEANINKLKSESHSVYPVCDGELDKIVGMVHVKDLYLKEIDNFTQDNLKEVIKEPLIILENMDAYQVLEVFKSHRKHQAVVVDEFGVVVGLVTLNDILEALVGDISDSPHEEYQLVDRGNDTYLVDGQYSFYDFATYFELEYGDFSEESFKTVAGFILHHLRHIPKEGEKFVWEQFTFEIMDMDGNKVDKLLVTVKEQAKNAD
jgi:putative hemolysin